jgi:ABC-2 type transport system permease protein
MSFSTVLRDDFRNTRRSYVVLGVIGALALFVGLIMYGDSNVDAYEHAFRALFDVSFFFFLVFPLILIPLTYLSVAGDRERGSIKHTLGLPNSRVEYVLGKFTSRVGVAIAAVLVGTVVAAILGTALYPNPIDPVRFALFAAISALFVTSMTAIFVAISTLTKRRSRAMFGVIFAYFVLGPFWLGFFPVISLDTIIQTVTDLFGASVSDTTIELIQSSSPTTAYLEGLEPVYDGFLAEGSAYPSIVESYEGDKVYNQTWYSGLVMAAWGALALAVSYVRFRVAELG